MTKEDQIKTAAAAWAHHEFGPEYRGYKFMGLNWARIGTQFAVYAFMPNSPLHPLDMMKQTGEPDAIDMTVNVHVENALCGIRKLIDRAWDNPESFRPVAVVPEEFGASTAPETP
jgi:hypothetical protein